MCCSLLLSSCILLLLLASLMFTKNLRTHISQYPACFSLLSCCTLHCSSWSSASALLQPSVHAAAAAAAFYVFCLSGHIMILTSSILLTSSLIPHHHEIGGCQPNHTSSLHENGCWPHHPITRLGMDVEVHPRKIIQLRISGVDHPAIPMREQRRTGVNHPIIPPWMGTSANNHFTLLRMGMMVFATKPQRSNFWYTWSSTLCINLNEAQHNQLFQIEQVN